MQTTRSPRRGSFGTFLQSRTGDRLLNLFIIILVALVLFLPPISLGERLLNRGLAAIGVEGGSVLDPDGTQATFAPEAMTGSTRARLSSTPRITFLEGNAGRDWLAAAEALPDQLLPRSPLYHLDVQANVPQGVTLSIPIPNDALPYETLDVYTWDGATWQWLPSEVIIEDDVLEARLGFVPANFMVMQTLGQEPSVGALLDTQTTLNDEAATTLTEVYMPGYFLGGDGQLVAEADPNLQASAGASYSIVPWVRNWGADGVVRTDLVNNLLVSRAAQDTHIAALTDLAVTRLYPAVLLDYRGIEETLRPEYSDFASRLSAALQGTGKRLIVRVEAPQQVADDRWRTGGYDWRALGAAADVLELPAPVDPRAYAQGGYFEQYLQWAVGQVSRFKLRAVLPSQSVELAGDTLLLKPYAEALAPLAGSIEVEQGVIAPGQTVTLKVTTANEATAPVADANAGGMLQYQYRDDAGATRTVWLETAASLASKLNTVQAFHLGGVTLDNIASASEAVDPNLWASVRQFQQSGDLAAAAGGNLVRTWQIAGLGETQTDIGQTTLEWQAPQEPGEYRAQVSLSGESGPIGQSQSVALVVASATPTFTPTPVATETPTPTPTPLPVTATVEPTQAPQAEPTQAQQSAPPPPVASTNTAGSFGYGVQAHVIENGQIGQVVNLTKGMGFGWLKQQIEWFRYEPSKGNINYGPMDEIANTASANGVQVMFSVVKAPHWARPANTDFGVEGPPAQAGDYADFVRALASRYCGKVQAYEIWNEQNLHYEWGNEPLDPGRYIQILAAAYNAIKSVCPQAIVISGALTPTGVNSDLARDDFTYLEQMYQAGLKNYSDAIGAHPSGYNVAPDLLGTNACDPAFIFRGPCDVPHHSWSFRSTMEGYRNIMVKYGDSNKRVWPTEFGWASSGAPIRNYEYAADNTLDEQAQYTVRAYQMMKQWGWVGVAFLWNMNFKVVAPGSEMAQWGIVDEGWGPMPVYSALASMPK